MADGLSILYLQRLEAISVTDIESHVKGKTDFNFTVRLRIEGNTAHKFSQIKSAGIVVTIEEKAQQIEVNKEWMHKKWKSSTK